MKDDGTMRVNNLQERERVKGKKGKGRVMKGGERYTNYIIVRCRHQANRVKKSNGAIVM